MEMEFDYVVVGAGSAGCALANRLSARADVSVCLIEAGGDDRRFPTRAMVNTPAGMIGLLGNPRYDWLHQYNGGSAPENRVVPIPRGKILGGTSAINGTIYMRGNPGDYDAWAQAGNTGWSYADVLPVFKEMEHREAGANEFHGVGGELNVARLRSPHGVCKAFVAAAVQGGHAANEDFNGATQEGFGFFDLNQKRGERMSSARSFLHPVAGRSNLHILTDATTRRVLIENRRAVGVEITRSGQVQTLRARREVALSAGTIGSPHLLMLSGIGPQAHLQQMGIAVVQDLPVGDNLHDHQEVLVVHASNAADLIGLSWRALPGMLAAPFDYWLRRRGPWTTNTVEAGGFLKTSPDRQKPDIFLFVRPLLCNQPRKMPHGHGFSVHVSLMDAPSRGQLRLRSNSVTDNPLLTFNFLQTPDEVRRLAAGVNAVRRIVAGSALDHYRRQELMPGQQVKSDADVQAFIRQNIGTTCHPAGTCKMGVDDTAVVDPQLRVRGIEGLRVADASIMPDITNGPVNAPAIMIGARCARFMLAQS